MNQQELNKCLILHKLWIYDYPKGVRANLSGADLRKTTLAGKAILSFQFQKHTAYFYGTNEIVIGCHRYSIPTWLKEFKIIGKDEGYTNEEIAAYGRFIRQCAAIFKKSKAKAKK